MSQTIDQFNSHIMGSYGRYDLVLEGGKDRVATDEEGKEYIDFGSGIGTNSLRVFKSILRQQRSRS